MRFLKRLIPPLLMYWFVISRIFASSKSPPINKHVSIISPVKQARFHQLKSSSVIISLTIFKQLSNVIILINFCNSFHYSSSFTNSFITYPAIIRPATLGTKLTLPGVLPSTSCGDSVEYKTGHFLCPDSLVHDALLVLMDTH